MGFVKNLSESTVLTAIPSDYDFSTINSDYSPSVTTTEEEESIPIIDFSLLTSSSPQQRSQIIQDLGNACLEWGFFMMVNHGIPEKLKEEVFQSCQDFFDLSEDEKLGYAGKHVLDPIRCGTSFNASVEKVFFWRDFLKVFVHPEFHSPKKPIGFSEISNVYSKRIREIARELLKGISESLGLEASYIEKAMELQSGLQLFVANLYPPCPQPELAMGMPPHSDHGLLTLLMQNDVGGLQVKHKGKWVHVNPLPNSILINTGDHLEILSNGKYKSVLHRATVNPYTTRISIAVAHGPFLDTVVTPAPGLVNEIHPPRYHGMKFKEYLELQQSNQLDGKSCLDRTWDQHQRFEEMHILSGGIFLKVIEHPEIYPLDKLLCFSVCSCESRWGLFVPSDKDLLTLLIQKGVDGLQVQHNESEMGPSLHINALRNSILVNTGDHSQNCSDQQSYTDISLAQSMTMISLDDSGTGVG